MKTPKTIKYKGATYERLADESADLLLKIIRQASELETLSVSLQKISSSARERILQIEMDESLLKEVNELLSAALKNVRASRESLNKEALRASERAR